jgi:hypothetical protein
VNILYCLEEWRGEQRISPPGDNFTPGGQLRPWGSKFAPRGEVKNGPQICYGPHSKKTFAYTQFFTVYFFCVLESVEMKTLRRNIGGVLRTEELQTNLVPEAGRLLNVTDTATR